MVLSMLVPFRRSRGAVPGRREVEPYRSLFHDMDRFLEDVWRGFGVAPEILGGEGFAPRVDIHETDKAIRVTAELPGLEEKDFDVRVDGDLLTIQGEKRLSEEDEREGYLTVERTHGKFQRMIRIPGEYVADDVKATYKQGILTVTLPKPPEAQSKVRVVPITTQ